MKPNLIEDLKNYLKQTGNTVLPDMQHPVELLESGQVALAKVYALDPADSVETHAQILSADGSNFKFYQLIPEHDHSVMLLRCAVW